jgi:hypothetical protein
MFLSLNSCSSRMRWNAYLCVPLGVVLIANPDNSLLVCIICMHALLKVP